MTIAARAAGAALVVATSRATAPISAETTTGSIACDFRISQSLALAVTRDQEPWVLVRWVDRGQCDEGDHFLDARVLQFDAWGGTAGKQLRMDVARWQYN